jgi:hypothetical protein
MSSNLTCFVSFWGFRAEGISVSDDAVPLEIAVDNGSVPAITAEQVSNNR